MDSKSVAARVRPPSDVTGLFVNLDYFDTPKPSDYEVALRRFQRDRSACPATRAYCVRLAS